MEGKANPSMPNASLNNIVIQQILLLHLEEDSLFSFGDYYLPSSDVEMIHIYDTLRRQLMRLLL